MSIFKVKTPTEPSAYVANIFHDREEIQSNLKLKRENSPKIGQQTFQNVKNVSIKGMANIWSPWQPRKEQMILLTIYIHPTPTLLSSSQNQWVRE